MGIAQQIIDHANSLFDVVSVSRQSNDNKLLVLGLESTPERNLDEFGQIKGQFQIYGFKKHFAPKVKSLLKFIQSKGFSAESLGTYGYPLQGEVNLKELVIRAGLAKRGKNTIALHPKYGTRLRFAAIETSAPLKPSTQTSLPEEENPICNGCSICIDSCLVNALEPYSMPDTSICLSNAHIMTEKQGRFVPCDICLNLCPAHFSN